MEPRKLIRPWLTHYGWSLQRLADEMRMDITKQALSLYEHGKRPLPPATLDMICTALSVSLRTFKRGPKARAA